VCCSVGSQVLIPELRKKSKSLNSERSTMRKGIEQQDIHRTNSCSSVAGLIELGKELRRRRLYWESSPCWKAEAMLSCWELACCCLAVSWISWVVLRCWAIYPVPPDSLYSLGQYLQRHYTRWPRVYMVLTGSGMCFQTNDVRLRLTVEEGNWGLVKRVDCSVKGGIVDSSASRKERVLDSGAGEAILIAGKRSWQEDEESLQVEAYKRK
jgi:hypothetical protein